MILTDPNYHRGNNSAGPRHGSSSELSGCVVGRGSSCPLFAGGPGRGDKKFRERFGQVLANWIGGFSLTEGSVFSEFGFLLQKSKAFLCARLQVWREKKEAKSCVCVF